MTAEPITYLSAFLVGLMGGSHCIGMCGGIMGALTLAIPPEQRSFKKISPLLLSYNFGRILSYTVAGAIAGAIGWFLAGQHQVFGPILRWFAGLMLIAMGLYLASWWSGLTKLEAVGAHLWKHLQPFSQRLLPVRTPGQALLLGGIWGWLPCGLVYSALAWSASAASIGEAALLMTFFGLGTLPAVLATGYFAKQITRFQRLRAVRAITGLLLIGFGLWTLPIWHMLLHSGAHHHMH